jgi:hypothetical protein
MDGRKGILIIVGIVAGVTIVSQLISSIFKYKLTVKAMDADIEQSKNKVKAAEKITAISEGWYNHGYPKEGLYGEENQQEGCPGKAGPSWHPM